MARPVCIIIQRLNPVKEVTTTSKMITVSPVKAIPAGEVGWKRRKKSVMIAKKVAQARWTKNTYNPCGHISLTPLPRPKPAAHSGRNNPYVSKALGR